MDAGNRFEVALIGCGAWGSNHARALSTLPMVRTVHLCDNDGNKAARIADLYVKTKVTRMEEVLSNSAIGAIFVATPAKTHAALVRQLLEAGKHVLVEKPFTMDPVSATELAELSIEKGLRLSVGYIMLHHPAFRRLQESLYELGSLYYLRAVRTNFGFVRGDVGVLWDLAPHDVSMILSISGGLPAWVRATGAAYVQQGFEDLIEIEMQFPTGQLATIHLSWIDPQKREATHGGGKQKDGHLR